MISPPPSGRAAVTVIVLMPGSVDAVMSRQLLTSRRRLSYTHTQLVRHMPKKNDILQGTLALLILKTLASRERMHGYGITSHIQSATHDLLRVEEGSLYPALHRMEQEGWIRAEWGLTDKQREARFYSLTAEGRRQLAREEDSWSRLTEGVSLLLRYV